MKCRGVVSGVLRSILLGGVVCGLLMMRWGEKLNRRRLGDGGGGAGNG